MTELTETVYTVRAQMVDGSQHDLLVFATEPDAIEYAKSLDPLPLGFDYVDVVKRRVIVGLGVVDQRAGESFAASRGRPNRRAPSAATAPRLAVAAFALTFRCQTSLA